MQYGYFDDENREYVITDSHTPEPWANYLGSPEYGAVISNNAGGYSFRRSGANGRILRYNFNGSDTPGRYFYIRDAKSGLFRCLSRFPDECRHGMGYTVMKTEFSGVQSKMVFYVPEGGVHEVWYAELENAGSETADFMLTGYAEFTNNSNYEQDTVNLQYSRFITSTQYADNILRHLIHGNLEGREDDAPEERHFILTGASVSSYTGDREDFLGSYGSYDAPLGVKNGDLGNTDNYGGCACGALSARIILAPGEKKYIAFLLAPCGTEEAQELKKKYEKPGEICPSEICVLKQEWEARFSALQVHTPDKDFDRMVNTWNAYNSFITFTWSRAASFVYCGLRNGYGYRDTVQDIQGIIHLAPDMAEKQISFMLSAQAQNGGGLPLVKFTHNPGHEDTPDEESYRRETGHPAWRADDALWLFPTVYKYIAETGNTGYLDKVILYADKGEDTVYEHLKNALRFSRERMGVHGMPAGLHADWNDCLRLGAKGESVFVAMQYYLALNLMREFALKKQDTDYSALLEKETEDFSQILEKHCFAGDRYIRGYIEGGTPIGAPGDEEAAFWLNPQSWSVISRAAGVERGKKVMDAVHDKLNTPYGAMLMMPPFKKLKFGGALAVIYNAGMKENAGVFSQSQGWLILAEALLGRGDRAIEYYKENCPAAQNDKAEIRRMEPYVYGQFTEGGMSPNAGRSHVHWLTGTASTMMVASVEGILGLRPDFDGLKLAPAMPSSWEEFTMVKTFRGKRLNITVKNPNHAESGFKTIMVNGEHLPKPYIPAAILEEENDIVLTIS